MENEKRETGNAKWAMGEKDEKAKKESQKKEKETRGAGRRTGFARQ